MKLLRRRPVADTRELAACVAAFLGGFFPGLRVADRAPAVAEAMADVVAVDAAGGLVLIVCEPAATPAGVLRALECAAWWRDHRAFIPRMVPGALEGVAPSAVVVAGRFPDGTLRVLRALGGAAPTAIECRLYDDGGAGGAAFEIVATPLDASAETPGVPEANGGEPTNGADAGTTPANPTEAAAAGVGDRLARLRFSEAFRSMGRA